MSCPHAPKTNASARRPALIRSRPASWRNQGMNTPPPPDAVRDEYAALPPDAQYAAAQFIAFLRRPPEPVPPHRPVRRVPLRDDPAIGQWKNRMDMEDSVEYVRTLRRKHWRSAE